jgi:hypothetical protein
MTKRATVLLLATVLIAGLWIGCKKEPPASLYDPTYVSGPQPKITGITPATGAYAGVTPLTINGQNFSSDPGSNLVFFDKTFVPVLSASTTQLQVTAPILPKDSIMVKVATIGSTLYSDPYYFKLDSVVFENAIKLNSGEEGVGVECDNDGNFYVSIISPAGGLGVKKYTPAGNRSDYSPVFAANVPSWKNMKFGPGGVLFCVANARAVIFSIPAGGGTATVWKSSGGLQFLADLDFDANGNIWAVGSGGSIFRVNTAKVVTVFPCTGTLRAVRVYNNAVYVGGSRDSLEKVWKYPIIGTDSLDVEQEYFNLSSVYATSGVYAMTFSSDGDLYIGTDNAEGIRIVHPDKTSEALYPGQLKNATVSLTWGNGNYLFQSRSATPGPAASVKINALKAGAPYYGRTLP